MTTEAAIFTCSICGEPSHEICVCCTKDACGNHHCERCKRCSDCCECEMPLSASEAITAPSEPAAPPPAIEPQVTGEQPHPEPESQLERVDEAVDEVEPPPENPLS